MDDTLGFVFVSGIAFGAGTTMYVAHAVVRAIVGRARERSRRELAAYVAEGSMTADEAERILHAGPSGASCCGKSQQAG